ncbi:hypothetical protein BgiMline_024352 [Biomphalaria glabrata]
MGSNYSVTGPNGHTFSFPEIMGSQDSVTGPHGHTFSFPRIMGSQDSVIGPYCLLRHTLPLQSWAVTNPSPGHMATHSPSSRSTAVKIHSLVRTIYGDTHSSPAIMGSKDSVTGPDCL